MYAQDTDTVVAELAMVYQSASARAHEATTHSQNTHLPMMERVRFRRKASEFQELADQALRMINELSAEVAA
jgi:hypothetical protein